MKMIKGKERKIKKINTSCVFEKLRNTYNQIQGAALICAYNSNRIAGKSEQSEMMDERRLFYIMLSFTIKCLNFPEIWGGLKI